MSSLRVAVIAGDGIGKEVVPEGQRIVAAAAKREGVDIAFEAFDWGCDYHERTGRMMPADGLKQIAGHDAIFLGAIGWPTVPDHVSLWELLMPIRRDFRQYVNLRPVRLFIGPDQTYHAMLPAVIVLLLLTALVATDSTASGGGDNT